MAYINVGKIWGSEFCNDVSAKDRVQYLNQLKRKVNDGYRKDEKIRTNFEASNPTVVINKTYLDLKISENEDIVS